ncbi:MAG: glycosyltransferase [Saprospiraceae bacterium]|nr:glycosyltransferase [Saprospiraceae bacterium]
MKILQLCKKFPFPPKDGEVIAINTLSKSLTALGAEVTLLTMNTSKHPVNVSDLPAGFKSIYKAVYDVPIYNHITAFGALKNLFEKESYHVTRFISDDFSQKLIEILRGEEFDVVQLETVFLTPYIDTIRQHSNAIVALRSHNVEHEIWKRVAEVTNFLPKRWYLNFLNKKLRRFELENTQKCDILLPITERDQRIFRLLGFRGHSVVTPVGLHSRDYLPNKRSFELPVTLGFIGALDWMPNQEGLRWFLDKVWSQISAHQNPQKPFFQLHIAGRNAPQWLKNLKADNVVFHGEVADAQQFMNQHSVAIVPLFSGSGIRVKILEAMMLGRVVLTTSMGLEGIPAQDGDEVLIANSDYDFIEKIEFCRKRPDLLRGIGERARRFAIDHFDSLEIAGRVLAAYESHLEKRKVNA